MAHEPFLRVFQPANAVELALARAVLHEMRVPVFIENEHHFTTGGGFLSHGDTEVWVRAPRSHASAVRDVLEERVRGKRPSPP
ncbi:MAG: hypothetical protein ACRELV_13320 [Longimicrobiales bacterium]